MRILVVEDDEQLAKVLAISLEQEGYVVDVEANGRRGFERASTTDYDAMLLDVTLPVMGGFEICKQLREDGNSTPVIMLTGRTTSKDRVTGLDLGADDYLTKPFSSRELFARLRAVLRRKSDVVQMQLVVGDLVMDPRSRDVSRAGTVISLMPKEYTLLEYLMRNSEKALSRDELFRHVWGVDNKHTSNRLDVYIKHLRSKIDANFEHKLIKTVRGIGYKITDK